MARFFPVALNHANPLQPCVGCAPLDYGIAIAIGTGVTRTTNQDDMMKGSLAVAYDYEFQCWVLNGIILLCGHLPEHRCNCAVVMPCKGKRPREEYGLLVPAAIETMP